MYVSSLVEKSYSFYTCWHFKFKKKKKRKFQEKIIFVKENEASFEIFWNITILFVKWNL
jgi:hypothetical protein